MIHCSDPWKEEAYVSFLSYSFRSYSGLWGQFILTTISLLFFWWSVLYLYLDQSLFVHADFPSSPQPSQMANLGDIGDGATAIPFDHLALIVTVAVFLRRLVGKSVLSRELVSFCTTAVKRSETLELYYPLPLQLIHHGKRESWQRMSQRCIRASASGGNCTF